MNNPDILEKIYRYYPLIHEKPDRGKEKVRKSKIDQKVIYPNELLTGIINIAKGYAVVDWTDTETCCYEFKILLHKDIALLDDDRELIRNLNGERKDLWIFISVLEPYYYMFTEKTSYFESEDRWEFRTEETNIGEHDGQPYPRIHADSASHHETLKKELFVIYVKKGIQDYPAVMP